MERDDYYRKQAEDAEEQAQRARNPEDKAAWLRIVSSWLNLLPKRARNARERFDEQARSEGTHQDVSDRKQ